jgi:hypothetical protein
MPIPSHDGYYADNDGRIYSLKELTPSVGKTGYAQVSISNTSKSVHRLVMMAFTGPSKLSVNHINFNRLDNMPENLEYVTHQENMDWNVKHGRMPKGELNSNSKMDWAKILTIHTLYPHKPDKFITDAMMVNSEYIQLMHSCDGWSHLGIGNLDKIDKRKKSFRDYSGVKQGRTSPLSSDEKDQILIMRLSGSKISTIAKSLKVSESVVDKWIRFFKKEGKI